MAQTTRMNSAQTLPPPERTAHPFYMYDMIRGIPQGFQKTVQVMQEQLSRTPLPKKEPLFLTGNGTAYYSCLMGSQFLAETNLPWKAVQAFDLLHYSPKTTPAGVVVGVSHSGITKNTVDALGHAKSRQTSTIAVTHFADRPISSVADRTFVVGDGPDKSRCHTKTYTDSAAAVLSLSLAHGKLHGYESPIEQHFSNELHDDLTETVRSSESLAKSAAKSLASNIRKVFVVGSGPNAVTAREVALKVKESSFLPAEGMMLEEILHGPWVTFDRETLLLLVLPAGSPSERALELLKVASKLGTRTAVVTGEKRPQPEADYLFKVPETPEVLSPFTTVIPFYFLSYFLAVEKGGNPDYLRYQDPVYWDARNIIFPSGTH